MNNIPNRIADILLAVEANLRVHGKWSDIEPDDGALNSQFPFCVDKLSFEEWLQWIFLPKMKDTIEKIKPLPVKSEIFTYAKTCLGKDDPSTYILLKQLKTFDDLINLHAKTRKH